MRDAETGSEWLHYTGECVVGPMAGKTLSMLTTELMTWRAFRERYAGATVIDDTPSLFRRLMGKVTAMRDVPSFFRLPPWFTRTMTKATRDIADMEFGLGVVVTQRRLLGGARAAGARFYPFKALRAAKMVRETLDGTPVVVLWDEAANAASAFVARLDDRVLDLRVVADGTLRDGDTVVDVTGRVTAGPHQGQRLPVLLGVHTRWYGFHQVHPDATVFRAA